MKNPGRAFGSPEAIEASTEENLPGPETASGVNADCLRRIVDAISRLDRPQA